MPIKNYTTTVGVFESLGQIQGALAKAGARKIMVDYCEDGNPCAITFGLVTAMGSQAFALPANVDGVIAVFRAQKIKADEKQAQKTAWRNLRDWILAQLALIESGMVQTDEVFLPYLTDGKGKTLYQLYHTGQLLLGGSDGTWPSVTQSASSATKSPSATDTRNGSGTMRPTPAP